MGKSMKIIEHLQSYRKMIVKQRMKMEIVSLGEGRKIEGRWKAGTWGPPTMN